MTEPIPRFTRIQPGKDTKHDMSQLNNQLEKILPKLSDISILNGIMTEEIHLISPGQVDYAHKLGREWIGYIITYQDFEGTVYINPDTTADKKTYISLQAYTSGNVKLWIF